MKQAILITGALGGLGSAIVSACQKTFPGHEIIATDLATAGDIPDGVIYMPLDVTDENAIGRTKKNLEDRGIRVWGIVNNAGISDFFPVSEKPKDHLDKLFAVNTFGAVNTLRAFLPHLTETHGRVVIISSESIRLPAAFHPYAASKLALEALSVSMRNELALKGVLLSIVRPGAINTAFLNDLEAMKGRIGESIYREALLRFAKIAPQQILRIVPPEKVAKSVVKALYKENPRRYYLVNNNPRLRLGQWLPHRLRDYFMKKMLEDRKHPTAPKHPAQSP
ncbi:MAG: SDR family NAD(P)-dependent oxidoreductase [Bacteroidales bacterium]|nr:SDR family NAD(P)-dependent oxidoreductase [Bacteroidales bacterium]